jgi:hypothetical protein
MLLMRCALFLSRLIVQRTVAPPSATSSRPCDLAGDGRLALAGGSAGDHRYLAVELSHGYSVALSSRYPVLKYT